MSNELEQRALDNAADDHDRRHTPQVVKTVEELEVGMVLMDANGFVCEAFGSAGLMMVSRPMGSTTYATKDSSLFPATVLYPHPTLDVDVLAEVRAWCAETLRVYAYSEDDEFADALAATTARGCAKEITSILDRKAGE